jgi:D-glycero-D-manno-heptose 1,7-bisphosphate phosphatase
MAGGKGTRIASVAHDVPKPMLRVAEKPILEHQIDYLRHAGLCDIIMVVGHLGSVIRAYFGDGAAFGVRIRYYTETEPLGTAGALFRLEESGAFGDERAFFLLMGDIIFDIDFERLLAFHTAQNALATLVSHPNSHPYDSALLVCDRAERVTDWLSKEDERLKNPHFYYKNRVNAGLHIIDRALLKKRPARAKADLDRDVLKPALSTGRVFAYQTPEYIKDMGTPERFAQVEADLAAGVVSARSLRNRQRAIFLDRDGTINIDKSFVTRPEDFFLINNVAPAIRRINDSGRLAIVITNQPVVARGACTFETLAAIHNKMETLLGREGAFLDAIFFCPHHPDKGFEGEVPELKIVCECRKPKPGMILDAAKKYNIDCASSWMVGDNYRDVLAGKAAGCSTAFLKAGRTTFDSAGSDMVVEDVAEFVEKVL